jgi:hypothetical protein
MVVFNGSFTQTGELNVNLQHLPQVYEDFFGKNVGFVFVIFCSIGNFLLLTLYPTRV